MKTDGPEGTPRRVTIFPSEYYSTTGREVISTLVGSCVAACLYDPKLNLIGMNHFMLSNTRYSQTLPMHISEAGRYGVHAMELLINDMMAKGTNRSRLRAKVFGGASILGDQEKVGNFSCVGEVNCRFIREYLAQEKIPIDAEDLGGCFGRVINFSNGDFYVYRRKIDTARSWALAQNDRECWRQAVVSQKEAPVKVELW